jgi:competence protein CoiA
MGLYAYEEDQLVNAADASDRQSYRCIDCRRLVKVRRGPFRVPHFYHLSRSPTCRLYSKSQDHLLAQLYIQKLLPAGETFLEKPFLEIARVADLIWERPKIAFEIQCSLLGPQEVAKRMIDYAKVGYQIVWILDDRIFNRRKQSPAEAMIRLLPSYYATLRKQSTPVFYDQFEIHLNHQRLNRGRRLTVQLQRPYRIPKEKEWLEKPLPKQVLQKISSNTVYFHGDLLHKALLSKRIPALAYSMHTLRVLEEFFKRKAKRERNFLIRLTVRWILEPFGLLILILHERSTKP